jgi:hypothetical protein
MLGKRQETYMFALRCVSGLSLVCLALSIASCTAPMGLDSVQVTPTTQALTVGDTAQFTAIGTYGNAKHLSTQNITSLVTWTSSVPSVATVNIAGVATAQEVGTTTITASATAFNGPVSSSATLTVTAAGTTTTTTAHTLTSIAILPGSQPVTNIGETGQFIAIGSYTGSPATQDLTNLVTWGSSDAFVAKIDPSGLATAISAGTTTITALYTQPGSGSGANPLISASATFTSVSNQGTVTLPTLTVYKVGPTASAATVTASYLSPTGVALTPINCAAGASAALCTGNFPVGVTVYFNTTNTSSSPAFGGWSNNCTSPVPLPVPPGITLTGGAYSCAITLAVPTGQTGAIGNVTVGAIFD